MKSRTYLNSNRARSTGGPCKDKQQQLAHMDETSVLEQIGIPCRSYAHPAKAVNNPTHFKSRCMTAPARSNPPSDDWRFQGSLAERCYTNALYFIRIAGSSALCNFSLRHVTVGNNGWSFPGLGSPDWLHLLQQRGVPVSVWPRPSSTFESHAPAASTSGIMRLRY